jgi:predicted acylesterase/phospholipase RssA
MAVAGTNRRWSWLAASCAVALLAGCASLGPQLPLAPADESESEDVTFGVRTLNSDGEFEVLSSAEIARRLHATLGESPLSILALSSGGASGAFGAGALVGSTRGAARPAFSVVTGVSAGALIAPFAFLGSSWDEELTAIFTSGVTEGLLQGRGLDVLFGSSLYSAEPLRRLIERYATDVMVDAVAAEAARGRLLLVATTDIASGEPVIWDLGSIALHGGGEAKQLFRSLLLASASVPGMFPPVVVRFRSGGRMHVETHVDGGVTLPFFVAPALEDLPQPTPAGAPPAPPATVHVIIDGQLRDLRSGTRANAYSIFRRSLSAGLSHVTRTQLESTVDAVRERGVSLDYAAIPASFPLQRAFDFGASAQRALFEYAASCAEAGRLWIRSGDRAAEERGAERSTAPGTTTCPADDSFIGHLAALKN